MDRNMIETLVARYNAQLATPEEQQQIETLLAEGQLSLEAVHDLHELEARIDQLEMPEPSQALDDAFLRMLREEKQSAKKRLSFSSWLAWFLHSEWSTRMAFASVTLIAGLIGGYLLRSPASQQPAVSSTEDIGRLSAEVNELKEMMMLSLLEKESAAERLKAVSLTEEMDQASQKVTHALIETLNHDSNVNVRLASLEALKPYTNDGQVREALIRSISQQDSPLVQIALAELMGALQAKSSVGELEKILNSKNTPKDVKKKIQETIQVLI